MSDPTDETGTSGARSTFTKITIRPPIYSGESDVNTFIEAFESAAKSNHWNDQQRLDLLPNFLTEGAKDWYQVFTHDLRVSAAATPTWIELKDILTKAFEVVASSLKYKILLDNRKQGPYEVEKYYYDVLN